jgi:DNA repair photolyase
MKPIYKPKGAALEYNDLALNLHGTCPHGCYYCYAPMILHKTKEDYFNYKGYRPDIVEATERQILNENITDRLIHVPFIGDAYPKGHDSLITRDIIKLLKKHGNHVQILTKNGSDAERDFDLLDKDDWFGVTITCSEEQRIISEPNAGTISDRVFSLMEANARDINTWVSCEPVLETDAIYYLIENGSFIDRFKIGKLNYHPSDINWNDFGCECERLCKKYGRDYYIKDGLRNEMDSK